jgi:arylformamidase
MKLYDVTLPMQTTLANWPGDTPFQLCWGMKKNEGATVNLSAITLSVHTGTHTDAPFHFDDHGATIDALDPAVYVGRARVVEVAGRSLIRIRDLETFDFSGTPRLLLRTGAWKDHTHFPDAIPVLAVDVPAFLHERGVVLVGLDVPSVDALDSKDLPNHHALGRYGIAILESLDLAGVPEGVYELIALPLKLVGADGAPVRAVLRVVS